MVFIYRQEILQDISLFTSQPKAKFYDELFINLYLSWIPVHNSKTGRTGYSNHAMICAFIVMKCEGFSQISGLHDYLSNNLIIAHYCGFDISRELPSYAKFTRFIREFDNDMLQTVMQSQVLKAAGLSLIDSSFIALFAFVDVLFTFYFMRFAHLSIFSQTPIHNIYPEMILPHPELYCPRETTLFCFLAPFIITPSFDNS